MSREDIRLMAREVGLPFYYRSGEIVNLDALEKFAAMIAAAEREECAKLADKYMERWTADAIRARGQA